MVSWNNLIYNMLLIAMALAITQENAEMLQNKEQIAEPKWKEHSSSIAAYA